MPHTDNDRDHARMNNDQVLTIGRMVHFVMPPGPDDYASEPSVRGALVTEVVNQNCANLLVNLDGDNDRRHGAVIASAKGVPYQDGALLLWVPSVTYDAGKPRDVAHTEKHETSLPVMEFNPLTWHWPPRYEPEDEEYISNADDPSRLAAP